MSNIHAGFWLGPNGQIFRLIRSPDKVKAHIIYVPPLFEDANRNRHVYTRSAIQAYEIGYQSIVYDLYGTGDSQGDLVDLNIKMWQQELLAQIEDLQRQSNKPIVLCCCYSAALLLNIDILHRIASVQFWQPEFTGKRFVQQLKRLAITQTMQVGNKNNQVDVKQEDDTSVEIAGYLLNKQLLIDISLISLDDIFPSTWLTEPNLAWFELTNNDDAELPLARKNQQDNFCMKNVLAQCYSVNESKYWQATEIVEPKGLLMASLIHLKAIIQ